MQAWLIDDMSRGVPGLRRAEIADPVPAEGEAQLEVHFAGLNPADRYLSEGQYPAKPPMPHILGRDGMGTVIAIGPGVSGVKVGQRCTILRSEIGVSRAGTFAQRVAVPVESLVTVPPDWTDEQAGSASLVYLTAYQAITQWPELPARGVVLVTGASGGVGIASIHLARAMGHTVVALSRDEGKRQKLLDLGAHIAMDPSEPTWRKQLKDRLAPQRVDLAIDNIGGDLLPQVIDTLGMNGRVSIVGRLAGPVPSFNTSTLFFRRIRLGGVGVGTYTPAESQAAWIEILKLLGRTGARPVVDKVFPFDELPAAFARLKSGPMGKVVLAVR